MTVSPETWVLLAHIVRPQGRHGEVLADIFTDFPEHFAQRNRLFLRPPVKSRVEAMREVKVLSHWLHKGRVVLKFAQVDSMAEAENLRGFDLVIPREERMPLTGDAVATLAALLPMGTLWYGWWFWAVLLFFLARKHPPVYDQTEIGDVRTRLGILALFVFLLCFSIAPIVE